MTDSPRDTPIPPALTRYVHSEAGMEPAVDGAWVEYDAVQRLFAQDDIDGLRIFDPELGHLGRLAAKIQALLP